MKHLFCILLLLTLGIPPYTPEHNGRRERHPQLQKGMCRAAPL